ncbi:MAG: hypothetical protein ABWK01_08220 [Infirmifilum sp.]
MESGEVNCNLIITCRKGHERAVLRDVLDLLFPYDTRIKGWITSGGRICLQTALTYENLATLFQRYPVRNLLATRLVLCSVRISSNLIDSLEELLAKCCQTTKLFRRLSIKLKAKDGWRQDYFAKLKPYLQLCLGGQWDGVIEKTSSHLLLEIKITPKPANG